jgi:hypothetical protein
MTKALPRVGAEQVDEVEVAGTGAVENAGGVAAASLGQRAELERADPAGGDVEHGKAVPAVLDDADVAGEAGGGAEHRAAIWLRIGAGSDDHERPFGLAEQLDERQTAGLKLGQGVGAVPEMSIGIGEVGALPDHPDRHAAGAEGATNAGIEHGGLAPRIGADDQDGVGPVDAGDGGIEQIAGPTAEAAERGMGFAAVEVRHAEALQQQLEREHLLERGEIADQRRLPHRVGALDALGSKPQRLGPAGRAQSTVLADIGPVEALRLEAVPNETGLVGYPLLVDVLMGAREDPHDFAAAGIDADARPDRVHDVDRFDLAQLPGAAAELVGPRGERADRAQVDDVALELGGHGAFEVGRDLHVLAAADGAELLGSGDLGGEADAARAMDAAVHRGLDQRPDIFVLDRPLVLGEAVAIDAIGHGLVLQVALAALVADRTVERMVDQEEFHDALAGLLHHFGAGEDLGQLAIGAGPQIVHGKRAGGLRLGHALDLDEAHAAVAGDRQALMIAEARDLGARQLASLEQRQAVLGLGLDPVDDELRHGGRYPCALGGAGPSPAAMSSSSVRSRRTSLIITVSGAWPRARQPSPSWKLHSMIQASLSRS